MFRTIEATIDEDGNVSLSESIKLTGKSRALLTILDALVVEEVTLMSEGSLSDWNRVEEDEAWAHLQSPR